MSIENFSIKYPPEKQVLNAIIEKERMFGISPVAFLARSFALEAGSGLREFLSGMNQDSGVGFALDPNSFVGVPTEMVNKIIRHHLGVLYGASVVELEHSMVEGYFDVAGWCAIYNIATAGTRLSRMKAEEGKSVEILDKEHLIRMRKFSSTNKTYSGFFREKEGIAFLPQSLKIIFSQPNTLSVIQREIIPVFEPRAALLIVPNVAKV